ncbi:unnamed protein product [Adineta ricciae]|uniref:B box-type domain-containing protein n=1 Tax=Adineta ricciae TaxID=249248 RepID=A0A814A139_ADIRI|nr:unnamed protein product [Adineta ricciae]CAF1193093.1 unnamed protein product [Adineta ricciae]
MASSNERRPCSQCNKGAGVAICQGCQLSFCIKHFGEHRQELSHQLEIIGLEHDEFRKDLNQYDTETTLLNRINTWEQESIGKIQTAAEIARVELRELLRKHQEEMSTTVRRMTDELQSSRESYDYTETDIEKWARQLQDLRKLLECPPPIGICEDNASQPTMRLIRVHGHQTSSSSSSVKQPLRRLYSTIDTPITVTATANTTEKLDYSLCHERFDDVDGKLKTLEDDHVVTCYCRTFLFPSIVYGSNRYSKGKHHIRLRVEQIHDSIFVGVTNAAEDIKRADLFDRSLFGWWDLVRPVAAGHVQKSDDERVVRPGDDVTLILDCDSEQIQLRHHRTDRLVELLVDVVMCPFPWRMVIKIRSEGDLVRILP